MNKIFFGLVILAAIAVAWFILNSGDTFDYIVTVDSEVTELENELADLDAQVTAGTLTEAQATQAKVKIITRLDAINTAATASENTQLTQAQRTQLANGLLRLKDALVKYQSTLSAVDSIAVEADVQARLNKGHNRSSRSLNLIVADTIEDVEETVQDSVQDYETDADVDAEIDVIVAEAETTETEEAADQTEAAMNGSEEVDSAEGATTTDEVNPSEAEMDTEEATGDEEVLDADAGVSSEAEIDLINN